MPKIEWADYLVDLLFEFGPVKSEDALNAGDILDIEQVLGVKFDPWESRLLIRLSREYKQEMHAATKRDAKPPFDEAARPWRWVQRKVSGDDGESRLDKFLS